MVGVCISGGGAKIGFAVGVLEVMEQKGIKIDLAYGVSSGSLCTAGLCYGDLQFLKNTLLGIRKRDDVLKRQWTKAIWTLITGWGKADGWFEMDTMRQKLNALPYDQPKMKGVVGYVKLQSGNIEYKSSDSVSKADFLDAVQASCSIPVYMQSQRVGTDNYVDGGVRDVLPLKALIKDPLNVDEIHVICLSPLMTPATNVTYKNIAQVAGRSVDLLFNEVLQNDYDYAALVNELIANKQSLMGSTNLQNRLAGKRELKLHRYLPTQTICGTTDFQTAMIQKGIDHGREIASVVLENYPSVHHP
jgi:predicted acylesterase/phospholipase RssA